MARRRPKERTVSVQDTTENTVLGLDCSSSTVGWGLVSLEDAPKLIAYGHIKPMKSKHGSLIERLNDVFDKIQILCDKHKPFYVIVEDIKKFMKGLSTAQTITILAAFNRVICVAAYQKVGDLTFYSESEIRKIIKLKYLNKKAKIGKEDVPDLIRNHLEPSFAGPLNTKGDIAAETLDEADGVAAAWAGVISINSEE